MKLGVASENLSMRFQAQLRKNTGWEEATNARADCCPSRDRESLSYLAIGTNKHRPASSHRDEAEARHAVVRQPFR